MKIFCFKETSQQRHDRVTDWHPWFAWRPVFIDPCVHWLEWVERKLTSYSDGYDAEYRPLDLERYP